ncbi:MAG: hypothetical protein HYZ53_10270 [Planctomycetes bacterium]|nr:hypothetical protein [Planctomycetota bacterium]
MNPHTHTNTLLRGGLAAFLLAAGALDGVAWCQSKDEAGDHAQVAERFRKRWEEIQAQERRPEFSTQDLARARQVMEDQLLASPEAAPLVKRFDTNGDGVLDEAERASAKESIRSRMKCPGTPGGGDGGGGDGGGVGLGGNDDPSAAGADAQATGGRPSGDSPIGEGRGKKFMEQQMLQKFDKNGDGKLDDDERGQARTEMRKRKGELLRRFDTDGDGTLNEGEKAQAKAALKERMQQARRDGGKMGQKDSSGKDSSGAGAGKGELGGRAGGGRPGGAGPRGGRGGGGGKRGGR